MEEQHNDTETLKLSKSKIGIPRSSFAPPEQKKPKEEKLSRDSGGGLTGWLSALISKLTGRS